MAGIDATGFVRKSEQACIAEIIAEARATVDPDYDESPDSVTGGYATIIGSKHAELWEVLEAVYGALSPNSSGANFDRVMAYSNSRRKPALATLLSVTVTGPDGVNAPGSLSLTVDSQPSINFTNRDALTITGGSGTGVFECNTTGPVRVPGGALSPNVTSFAEVFIGNAVEADPAARLRRIAELADQGTGTQPALRAAISKLANVLDVRVYSNRTFEVDADGRPPKSVEALVLVIDSTDPALQPIADTIWANLSPGIETYGAHALTVVDEEGHSQPVNVSVATGVNLYVRLGLSVDPAIYPGDDAVRALIGDFSAGRHTLTMDNGYTIPGGFALGAPVTADVLAAAARSVPGVKKALFIEFSLDGVTGWHATDHALTPREYLGSAGARGFATDHILVSPV